MYTMASCLGYCAAEIVALDQMCWKHGVCTGSDPVGLFEQGFGSCCVDTASRIYRRVD